jgi:hypothetical protein
MFSVLFIGEDVDGEGDGVSILMSFLIFDCPFQFVP